MSQPVKSRRIPIAVPVLLLVFLILELMSCPVFLSSAKRNFIYGMKYERNPLEMKSVTVTNREDQKEIYDCYGKKQLYEVVIRWDNIGSYQWKYRSEITLAAKDGEGYVYEVRPLRDYELGREEVHMQMVPAAKSACFVWYICADEAVDCIRIGETGEKLEGEGRSVEVPLPEKPGETVTVQITE